MPPSEIILAHHVDDWDLCHGCGGSVEGGSVTINGRFAYQEVHCLNCDRYWLEVYKALQRESI